MRVLTYSYDACGLGHLRRNLAIGHHLITQIPDCSVLSIMGAPRGLDCFDMCVENLDYVKLPSVQKTGPGEYDSAFLRLDEEEIFALRTDLCSAAVVGFQPNFILIDKDPQGLRGEMVPALREIKRLAPSTRVVLGLRDVLDDPQIVRSEWEAPGMADWIEEIFDAVWVWGEPEVFDTLTVYDLPEPVTQKAHYLGYLPPHPSSKDREALRSKFGVGDSEKLLLVTGGGGGDAFPVFRETLGALTLSGDIPLKALLVTGPMMPDEEFDELERMSEPFGDQVKLERLVRGLEDWVRAADAVVCMGGYNTLREVAALGTPALVIPRVYPRIEQLLRARKFEKQGWCKTVDLDDTTHRTISEFCVAVCEGRLLPPPSTLACRGLDSLLERVESLMCATGPTEEGSRRYRPKSSVDVS